MLLTTKEAAAFLKMSVSHVYQLKAANRIPYHQIGAKVLFIQDELLDWVRNGGTV